MLRHTRADRSSHLDWLIERPGDTREHRCITFRVDADEPGPRAGHPFEARRLPDHRAHYLDYQGPVSRNRGDVVRLASWTALVGIDTEATLRCALGHDVDPFAEWEGLRIGPSGDAEPLWRFRPASR